MIIDAESKEDVGGTDMAEPRDEGFTDEEVIGHSIFGPPA
jgi:hypothetical protein